MLDLFFEIENKKKHTCFKILIKIKIDKNIFLINIQ